MQGLRTLYENTGRLNARQYLVEAIVPDFVDPDTEGPLPGREGQWSLVTGYRVRNARAARRWSEAERLQRLCVDWSRERAEPALATPAEERDDEQRDRIRSFAAGIGELAQIQRELGDPACVEGYLKAKQLFLHIGDRAGEAIAAFNLGHTRLHLSAIRDLDAAMEFYQESFELLDVNDRHGRAKCLMQIGLVEVERYFVVRNADLPPEEVLEHINNAASSYHDALLLLPETAVQDLQVAHNSLGSIYREGVDIDRSLTHYRQAIRYAEIGGDEFQAGRTRTNVAITLIDTGRFIDARAYAEAAIANFATFGDRAADAFEKAQRTLETINQTIAEQGKNS